ncbi:unnamed protein product [Paramecium pentaurelia]|uniref:Uncharacterized protein n=1 Tax=Paramecium pentaurelia TaxID=43138 RepID=A0A8S1WAE3_9CILI|nr:unnamed protein product [Paramecium pentaurelia]
MHRKLNTIPPLNFLTHESYNERHQINGIQSEATSPNYLLETPVLTNKHQFRKNSNHLLPMVQQSSPYIKLPMIEEKFLTPRQQQINLMPDLTFKDLFKNPIYYEKNGLSPKGSEEILKKLRMRHRRVDFSKMVDIVDETTNSIIKESLNDHKEHRRLSKKTTRRFHLSNPTQLTEFE